MTVPINNLGLVKFWRKAIKKNKALVEVVEALQKRVTEEKIFPKGVEKGPA